MDKPGVIVCTRFGVGVTDPAWFEGRFALFEAITLPSLRAQADQDFHWLIFVGENPLPKVIDRLSSLLKSFGSRAQILLAPQNVKAINAYARAVIQARHAVVALIDDDDAWHVDLVGTVRGDGQRLLAQEPDRPGHCWTYPEGYEYLIADMVDLDAFTKGRGVVVRKSACYPYRRPFHSMSYFSVALTGACPEFIGALHRSHGAVAREAGYGVPELGY